MENKQCSKPPTRTDRCSMIFWFICENSWTFATKKIMISLAKHQDLTKQKGDFSSKHTDLSLKTLGLDQHKSLIGAFLNQSESTSHAGWAKTWPGSPSWLPHHDASWRVAGGTWLGYKIRFNRHLSSPQQWEVIQWNSQDSLLEIGTLCSKSIILQVLHPRVIKIYLWWSIGPSCECWTQSPPLAPSSARAQVESEFNYEIFNWWSCSTPVSLDG